MKKGAAFFFAIIFCISLCSANIRINEIELNPEGDDSGKEWIEFYSLEFVNLQNYTLKNYDNDSLSLNFSFQGYYVLILTSQWLDNSNEGVFLYNSNGALIDSTAAFSDSYNDNRTWQHCNGNWKFVYATKNQENNCTELINPENEQQQNETEISDEEEQEEYLKLSWDKEDIINGEEFTIEIKAYNLDGEDYDLKVYIEGDGSIISQIYDEDEGKWISGNYYVDEVFSKKGDDKYKAELRIKEDYSDFEGKAKIIAKIRKNSKIIADIDKKIDILPPEITRQIEQNKITGNVNVETINYQTQDEIIELKNIDSMIYKSGNEYIIEYAVYALIFLGIVTMVLLFFQRKNGREKN